MVITHHQCPLPIKYNIMLYLQSTVYLNADALNIASHLVKIECTKSRPFQCIVVSRSTSCHIQNKTVNVSRIVLHLTP